MFRTFFAFFVLVTTSIPWMVYISISLLLRPKLRGTDFSCYFARTYWCPWLFWSGDQVFELIDAENCPSEPCMYLCNHQGTADITMIYMLPVSVRFVAKESIKYFPFLGWYMLADKHIFIDRTNRKRAVKSLREAGERIRGGMNVVMFPEGTRTEDGKVLPFKKGAFQLALEAQVPIVPMALEGAREAWPKGKLWINKGHLRLKVGKPIPTKGLNQNNRDALIAQVRGEIIKLHESIGGAKSDLESNIAVEGGQGEGSAQRKPKPVKALKLAEPAATTAAPQSEAANQNQNQNQNKAEPAKESA
jgi:1-acyl-sn-glycerol-3-phosphate acyltransferase